MKGFYIYCIRWGIDSAAETSFRVSSGVEFGGKISAVPFKDIEAVVSDINLSQFNEKKIENKLQEDQKWTEKNIRCHHDVIAKVYEASTVIPMKFGTIFKTKKSLETMLKKHYRKFKRLLADIGGKQEWGVKIYLEYEKFVEFLKKENEEVKKLEEEKSTMPEGMQWYADKKIDELIAEESEEEIEKQLERIAKKLEDCCEQIALCDLLPKEVTTGMNKDNVFNAACLVDNNKLEDFKRLLQELEKEYSQIGGVLIATGPWPPYNFVQLKDAK